MHYVSVEGIFRPYTFYPRTYLISICIILPPDITFFVLGIMLSWRYVLFFTEKRIYFCRMHSKPPPLWAYICPHWHHFMPHFHILP